MSSLNRGKTICITGASSGIGLALSRLLAKRSYKLALAARRVDELRRLQPELISLGASDVMVAKVDVGSDRECEDFSKELRHFSGGRVWGLCNNAGLALSKTSVLEGDPKEWRQMMDTNLFGVLSMTRHIAPHLERPGGQVIMTGSISGHQVYEGGAVYCASKYALRALTQTLRLEWSGTGIRVGSVDPGMVETEFSLVRFSGNKEQAESVYKDMTPLSALDVAECIDFILSRPPHVNIDQLIVMPTDQSSVSKVSRRR